MKIHVVLQDEAPLYVSKDKMLAHAWAEGRFGSKTDGICVNNVEVRAFTDDRLLDRP